MASIEARRTQGVCTELLRKNPTQGVADKAACFKWNPSMCIVISIAF